MQSFRWIRSLKEGGVGVYECPEHSGLHIDTERSFMEVVDRYLERADMNNDGTQMNSSENSWRGFKEKTILILTPAYPNADNSFIADIFVKNQLNALKQYFEKVLVIAPLFQSFGFLKKDKLCKNYSYDNVEVYFPHCFYIPIDWFNIILIDNRIQVVEKTIKKYNLHFDLIHAHFTWPSGYIGVRLKETYGKPVFITIHENGDWFDQEVSMDHHFINATWSGADALIRVNKKDIPILKLYNKNVYGIPNGFSPAFHPIDTIIAREQLGISRGKKILFSLGDLIKRKGFNYLIDAMDQICRKRNDVICYIGGGGRERESLERQINQLQLGEKVRLLGSVPNKVLPLWMNACDLFVLPSLNEGNPTVMFEALGSGKPFVGTNVGGVPEVIISEEYGILVRPGDPDDLSEKILEALDKDWDSSKIAHYAEQFTWENVCKEIVKIYKEVLC